MTVDQEEAKKLGKPWTRRYIYNQKICGRCKSPILNWSMAARTVYCCPTCQKVPDRDVIPSDRRQEMASAKAHQPFVSHCVQDEFDINGLEKFSIGKLK